MYITEHVNSVTAYVFTFAVNNDSKRREKFVRIKIINYNIKCLSLILNPLTWKIRRATNNASRWQMGFNSAFKGYMIRI